MNCSNKGLVVMSIAAVKFYGKFNNHIFNVFRSFSDQSVTDIRPHEHIPIISFKTVTHLL